MYRFQEELEMVPPCPGRIRVNVPCAGLPREQQHFAIWAALLDLNCWVDSR